MDSTDGGAAYAAISLRDHTWETSVNQLRAALGDTPSGSPAPRQPVTGIHAPDAGGTRFLSVFQAVSHLKENFDFVDSFVANELERFRTSVNGDTVRKLRDLIAKPQMLDHISGLVKALQSVSSLTAKFTGGDNIASHQVYSTVENFFGAPGLHQGLRAEVATRWSPVKGLWRDIAMFNPRTWFAGRPNSLKQVFQTAGYPFVISDEMDVAFGTIVEQLRGELSPCSPTMFWTARLPVPGAVGLVARAALSMLNLRPSTSQVEGLISRCAFLNDKRRSRMSDVRAARVVFCLGNRDELMTAADTSPTQPTASSELPVTPSATSQT